MMQGTDSAFHQALCVTDDQPGVTAALAMVLGVAPQSGGFSWQAGNPALIGTLLGPTSAGAIEIAPLPDELRGRLSRGTTAISFAVDDLDERVAACRAAGLAVVVGVDVDPARRHQRPGGVDLLPARPGHRPDLDHPPVIDGQIRFPERHAGPVGQEPVADHEVVCHGLEPRMARPWPS